MEAVQYTQKERKLEHVRKPRPTVSEPKDVVIKVFFSGICGQDLLIIDGLLPCIQDQPVFLGHEFCGIVNEMGEGVTVVSKGDRVVVDPNSGCGICSHCRTGTSQFCCVGSTNNTIGSFKNGGWAQYVLVPEHQVYKLPDEVLMEQAVLAEPMARISHGWDMISPVAVGQKILIVGTGLNGDLWAALLYSQGHRKVTVSESNLARLEYIQKLEIGVDCITPVILKERQEQDPTYLFDLIIDCSGSPEAIEQEVTLLNPRGKLCLFGLKHPEQKISALPFHIHQKEITIVGVNFGTFDFPKALTLLETLGETYLDFEKLGIKTYALRDFRNAVDHVRKESVVKAVFSMAIHCTCPKKRESLRKESCKKDSLK